VTNPDESATTNPATEKIPELQKRPK